MNISIDYDGTYSVDPKLWDEFIQLAESRGHKLWCVTKREPELSVNVPIPVIYTSRRAKIEVVERQGIHIDVWIEDEPTSVTAHG